MIRVAIVNEEGKLISPEEVPTAADLQAIVSQARNLIRDCERLAQAKAPHHAGANKKKAPYS